MSCPGTMPVSVLIVLLFFASSVKISEQHNYGRGFLNHTGCMYAYTEGGEFEMTTADGDMIGDELSLDNLNFDSAKTRCTKNNEPGKIVFTFKIDEKTKIKSVTVAMKVSPSLSEGHWEISQANLTIARADVDRKRTFPLRVNHLYASLTHSFSCSELTLQSLSKRKSDDETGRIEPSVKITLKRFQLQPFAELDKSVFGSSFDCATWLTVPSFMGLVLIVFMTAVVVIGAILLLKIETNDFKYIKEGQFFTQSQMESNKQR